jgi:4-hydroxybenzoate polyprenyltransferase
MSRATVESPRARSWRLVADLLEMIKFSHTLFALPFAVLSALIAAWSPSGWRARPQDWLGILLCMVFARSASMAFNRLVDHEFDAANPRTASRHLPSGRLSQTTVWSFTILAAIGFIAATTLFLPNIWPLALSGPVLAWLLGYSYSKRFSELAHFWLGVALGFAPVAAWLALRGTLAPPPICLGAGVLFWVAGFDILYACQDVDFDRSAGLRSIPARIGVPWALRLAALCHLLTVLLLATLGFLASPPLGAFYAWGVSAVALLLIYEHAIVRPNDLSKVNRAFFQVNAIISIGLLGSAIFDLAWR